MNHVVVVSPAELEEMIRRAVTDATRGSAQPSTGLLTSGQVAELLGVSPRSIAAMVRRDGLPAAMRLGRGYRFRRDAVHAWVEQRANAERKHSSLHVGRLRRLRGLG